MGGLKEYIIPFIGLKDGSHEFSFRVNDAFFEEFPDSEIKKADIRINAEMIKRPHMLSFDVRMEGQASLPCDRCGNDYREDIRGNWQLVISLNADAFNDEDDLISLPAGAHEFDLAQYIYEYVNLLLPSRRVCGDPPDPKRGNCDPDIIAQLEKLAPGTETDTESPAAEDPESDPRWDALKNIKFDK